MVWLHDVIADFLLFPTLEWFTGATKGNSGIVHAGYDDKPGSVRARFCWPGNQMYV